MQTECAKAFIEILLKEVSRAAHSSRPADMITISYRLALHSYSVSNSFVILPVSPCLSK